VNYHYSYLNSSKEILLAYKGNEPFASFLKNFFAQYKKYGSRDRKQISHLCYCYLRLGKSLMQIPIEERILTGLFLCSNKSNEVLKQLKPEWNEKVHSALKEKLLIIGSSVLITDVFHSKEALSEEIDHEKFCESFFIQPDLFLRLRPGHEKEVKRKLQNADIVFKEINSNCLSLDNASKIDEVIELDKEAVIQDYSSQQTGEYFKLPIAHCPLPIAAWDCCAASGGKSLMLYDLFSDIDLTVSDIRESILANLKKRFARAGKKNYKSFVGDLAKENIQHLIINNQQSIIIADVPCTGSGTWSRTPELLYFFDENKIEQYASLQKKIVSNIIPHLKQNGYLIYITCSVFKKENEEVVEFIKREFNLELIEMKLLKGYDKKADTMFVALLRKL